MHAATPTSNSIRRRLRLVGAALLSVVLASPQAFADPVAVNFLPPQLPPQKVCAPRQSDADIIAKWVAWDGVSALTGDADDVLREARRLRDIDANKYFDLIEKMLAAQARMPSQKVNQDNALDRIDLYLQAGRIADLRKLKLVDLLASAAATLTPKALNTLSGLYLEGVVVDKDEDRGLKLLVAAANGGNPDALLALAKMNVSGQKVPGWTLSPKLAVTMAFGALVGKLDPEICDRLGRIAREYAHGDTVNLDNAVSEKWYRLAADLGDYAAAWKVANLHLASELITKDNDVMMKYLRIAADGGVPQAQVELGKIYVAGALIPEDDAAGEKLFNAAAGNGSRNALIRLSGLYESEAADNPEARAKYEAVLNRLTAFPESAGQSYAKLAKLVLIDKGRWGGEAAARAYEEEGVAVGDPDSAQGLAQILFAHTDVPGNFERATELLNYAVISGTQSSSMATLHDAYLCREAGQPDLRLAAYWQASADAAGNQTPVMDESDIQALVASNDAETLATLQTRALYGRASAVADYTRYLQQSGAPADVLAFWDNRIDAAPATLATVARHNLKTALTMDDIGTAVDSFTTAEGQGVDRAKLDLASVYLDRFPDDQPRNAEAEKYLTEAAYNGDGEAITRLLALNEGSGLTRESLYQKFESAIDQRGDSDALIFASQVTADPQKRATYLREAASIMPCTFDNSYRLAEAYSQLGNATESVHWLNISLNLTEDKGYRYGLVADQFAGLPGEAYHQQALDLYAKGVAEGDGTSLDRLTKIYADPKSVSYSPNKAVALFKQLIATAQVDAIDGIIAKLQQAPIYVKTTVSRDVSLRDVYTRHAESGDVDGMRALAKYLQDNPTSPKDGVIAVQWLQKAVDQGDPKAMVALAKAYSLGTGVAPSFTTANDLLQKAAALGSNEAQKLVANMANSAAIAPASATPGTAPEGPMPDATQLN